MQSPAERLTELQRRFASGVLMGLSPEDLRKYVTRGSELVTAQRSDGGGEPGEDSAQPWGFDPALRRGNLAG